jgi:hypothetical protein
MEELHVLWDRATAQLDTTTYVIAGVLALLLYAFTWCRIFAKAGHNGALGLLMLVPGINLILQSTFALGRWPIERELGELRGVRRAVHRADARTLRRVA